MTKHTISAALLGGLALAWTPPAAADNTWGLQIYFEPLFPEDTGDTAMFFDCLTANDCGTGNFNHIPPYDIDAGSHYPGLHWVFMSVPDSTWYVWAGCRPPYPCAPGGNSQDGSWSVITYDGINLGPTIVMDKPAWRTWAFRAQVINTAASIAANTCYYLGNKPCQSATAGVAAMASAAVQRFTHLTNDPYDPDWWDIPSGDPWGQVPWSGDSCGDNAMWVLAQITGLGDGAATAADRYPSALVNNDQGSANNQAWAVNYYLGQLHQMVDPMQWQLPDTLACGPQLDIDVWGAIWQLQTQLQSNWPNDNLMAAYYTAGLSNTDILKLMWGDWNTGVPGMAYIDQTLVYYAFAALYGPYDGRNDAWINLSSSLP